LLTPDQADRLEVLLVSPRNPLNIGAAARAMANFGFRRLTIVAPFAHNWMEAKSAVGAPDLLRDARVCDTLAEAVASCNLVIGTGSLDRRRPEQAILTLPHAAAQIRRSLAFAALQDSTKSTGLSPFIKTTETESASAPGAGSTRIALLFGSEKHGLTTEDLSWCHAITVIETADAQPSMNLGQAVAVCLYEISRLPDSGIEFPSHAPDTLSQPNQATSAQLDRLAQLIEETMESVNYATRGMRSANGEALRILLRRLMPQDADLRRIMGLFRRILWQLRHKS
jgi:tRNA C32,U32 (ribose-2'-O)-methylase TrmJ